MAHELYGTVSNYLQRQVDDNVADRFTPVILHGSAGNLNGFFLIEGRQSDLDEMRNSDQFREITTKCNFILEDFGVITGYSGDGVDEVMKRYRKVTDTHSEAAE
jgi:hypothetical protein